MCEAKVIEFSPKLKYMHNLLYFHVQKGYRLLTAISCLLPVFLLITGCGPKPIRIK